MLNIFKKNTSKLPDFWKRYAKSFENKIPEHIDEISFVVLDTETTGFDYSKDRILCIGALKLQNQQIEIKNGFEVYVKQEIYSHESAKIHGILKNNPEALLSELEVLEQFLNYIENSILIAHHAIFDITMINNALVRHHLPALKKRYLDTSDIFKKTLIQSNLLHKKTIYSLDEIADKYAISKKDRHTAMGDAYITALIFLKIVSKLREKKEVTLKWLFK